MTMTDGAVRSRGSSESRQKTVSKLRLGFLSVQLGLHFLLGHRREVVNIQPSACQDRLHVRRDQFVVQVGGDGQFW